MRICGEAVRILVELVVALIIGWLLFTLCALFDGRAADAYDPDGGGHYARGEACSDQRMLAFILVAESNGEPESVHRAIAYIVAREARQRGITVCQLADTGFVGVKWYALRFPDSWTGQVYRAPLPVWSEALATAALAEELPDTVAGGAMHFDGNCHRADMVLLWMAGGTCFYQ